jgi:hypothetical protein
MKYNNGRLFQIEVDVLQVLDPQILVDLLVSNVERYFDQSALLELVYIIIIFVIHTVIYLYPYLSDFTNCLLISL